MKFFSKNQSTNQSGVTLIEIMLVIAIVVILAAITVPIESGILTKHYLSSTTEDIQTTLRSASLKAKIGSYQSAAGVYFGQNLDKTPSIVAYRGDSFESRKTDLDEPIEIAKNVEIIIDPLYQDVHFSMLTGAVAHDTIIKVKNSAGEKIIHVTTAGTVFVEPTVAIDSKDEKK